MHNPPQPIIVQNNAGKDLHAFGNILSVMLSSKQTGGKISVMTEQTPPGGGPLLHRHSCEDELFIVIEGQLSYFANETWTEVAPGGVVYLPRGTAHTYRNTGTMSSRHWIITLPSGFEDFFAACAEEFAKSSSPDMARIAHIHLEYGIELLGEAPPPG